MKSTVRFSSRFSLLAMAALVVAGAALLTGCQTPGSRAPFPQPDGRWKTSVGQLRYATPERAVIGDATVSRLGAEEFQLDFLTGPGVPLIRVQESGNRMQAEGIFARGRWSGRADRAGRLGSWASLREVFAALETSRTAVSPAGVQPGWTARKEPQPPKSERITVEFPKSQERFTFVLTR